MRAQYPFTLEEAQAAHDEWGCNCGPGALAFAIQRPLDAARHSIPDFERKRYTSPSMMRAALEHLRIDFVPVRKPTRGDLFDYDHDRIALVRVQWGGPWLEPGRPVVAAYPHTHWITTWLEGPAIEGGVSSIFDINCGVVSSLDHWEQEVAPKLMAMAPRRDGTWHPTHIWRLGRPSRECGPFGRLPYVREDA